MWIIDGTTCASPEALTLRLQRGWKAAEAAARVLSDVPDLSSLREMHTPAHLEGAAVAPALVYAHLCSLDGADAEDVAGAVSDADGSGSIDWEEFVAAVCPPGAGAGGAVDWEFSWFSWRLVVRPRRPRRRGGGESDGVVGNIQTQR